MSQLGKYYTRDPIETLTGNAGGAVGPTAGNVDLLGAGFLTVTGVPATSILTISDDGTVATTFTTDAGNAIPALNILNVLGGTNIDTSGAGSTVTVNLSGTTDHAVQVGNVGGSLTSLALGTATQILQSGGALADPAWSTATYPATTAQGDVIYSSAANTVVGLTKDANATRYISNAGALNNPAWAQIELTNGVTGILPVTNGGTGIASPADHSLLVGSGALAMDALAVGATNEVLLGNTGADPSWGTVGNAALTNSSVTLSDGNNITVTGSPLSLGGTASFNLTGTTENAVQTGNAGGSLTSLAVGTDGQCLLGSTGASPVFATLTSTGGTVAFTIGAGTLNLETSGALATSYLTDDANSAVPAAGVLTVAGGANIGTSSAASTVTIALNGTTDHAVHVGNAAGSLTALAVGATNEVLLGNTTADPSWGTVGNAALTNSSVTLSDGNNITVTGSPLSLGGTASFDLTGTTQYAIQVGDATGSLDSLARGTATQVMQSGGAAANPAWSTATYPATTAQGDVIYSSAANTVVGLTKDATATRYLANTGASNNPAWDQVELTNGVSGILPVTNGGTGLADPTDHSVLIGSGNTAMTELGVATDGQLIIGSSAADPVLATLTAGTGVSITNAAGAITVNAAGVDQSNIIYVGKHGNDANDGLTIDKAKLTFGSAITAAFAIAPASVVCFDEGTYTENLTGQVGVHIFAPNCNIVGAHTIVSGNKWEFGNATVATGTTGFTFNSAGNIAKIIIGRLTSVGTGICVACIAGNLYLRTYRVNLEAGYLVGTATAGEVFIRADVIHMTGAATVIGVIAGAHIDLLSNHIHDEAGTGTLVYSVAVGASNICITATSIEIEVLSNITAATVVHLNASCLTGTLTESGAGKVTTGGATKIENVPIGAITPSTGDFTTITTTNPIGAAYGGTGIASPTDHALIVGSGAAAMDALAVGATNEVLLGNTTADPSWGTVGNAALTNSSVTLTSGANITVTGSPLSLGGTATIALSGCTQYALQVGDATNSLDSLAVGDATQILQSGGAGAIPAWSTATYPATTTQGDVIYSSANNTVVGLAKDATATRYLANTGATNNPAWDQVELTNGVSGILPVGNGGTGLADPTNHVILIGSGAAAMTELAVATDGQLIIGSSAADPVLATLTAGTGIAVTNAAGSITIATTGGGTAWEEVTDATKAMVADTAYGANRGAGVTFTLPATMTAGLRLEIVGIAGLWSLAQNAGQTVYVGNTNTTAGAGGTLTATNAGDCIQLVCTAANTSFRVVNMIGNLTVV